MDSKWSHSSHHIAMALKKVVKWKLTCFLNSLWPGNIIYYPLTSYILSTDVKAHLYKTIGLPSLLYGIESVSLNQTLMKSLECAQSNIVKNIMGFNKRSHHSNLLHAVRIDKVEASVIRGILSLWYRIYQVDNPARVLSNAMLCDYINSRHLIPGTLIHLVVEAGF